MVRHGQYKLILFGQSLMRESYPPLLFNLEMDPWELDNLAESQPAVVEAMEAMLLTEYDYRAVDREVKEDDLARYRRFIWGPIFRNGTRCSASLATVYHGFDAADARKVRDWSGMPCE